MGRILLSLCLLAVSAWPQTITVTSPAAGAVWKKGEARAIQWTKQGETGASVRIVLRAPGQTAAVLEIADPAPNSGSFAWTIPDSVAAGTYVIRVRSKTNNQATDDSDQFQIKEKDGAAPLKPTYSAAAAMNRLQKFKIEVTQPAPGRQYTLGDRIDIVFETSLGGPYLFDLMNDDGTTVARSFGELNGTLTGPNTHSEYLSTWPAMDPPIATGWYRIRVRTARGIGSGVGNRIHIARPTKEVLVQLQPTVRDRHSRRRIDTEIDWQPDGTEHSQPGLARAGGDFRYHIESEWWVGFIFRSQVTFPVEQIDMKGRTLKDAWIYIEEKDQRDGHIGYQPSRVLSPANMPSARGWKIFALTGPWDGNCIDTPGYQIGEIPLNADSHTVHLTNLAKDWIAGTKPNHGLIIGSRWDTFPDWTCFLAVSWYKVTLNLEFQQEI